MEMTDNTNPVISASIANAHRLEVRRKKLAAQIRVQSERLRKFQNARLICAGVFFLLLVVLTLNPQLRLEAVVLAAFFAAFIWLFIATRRIAAFVSKLERYEQFVSRQELRLKGGRPSGRDWKQVQELAEGQRLPRDLVLFGPLSIWTLIDETLTDGGLRKLLGWLGEDPNTVEEIQRRQEQVKALRGETWFYTRLCIQTSGLLAAEQNEVRLATSQIAEFLRQPFTPEKFTITFILNWVIWIAAAATAAVSAHLSLGIGPYAVLIFAVVSLGSVSKVSSAFIKGVGLSHHLSELAPIFTVIEKRLKISQALRPLMPQTYGDGPARQVRKLNRVLGFLGTQTNPLLHLVLNAFTPWALTAAFFLERRRRRIENSFPVCMAELAELEALGCLVLLDHYQTQTYPTVRAHGAQGAVEFRGLFHPLLDREKVVANDFAFPPSKSTGLLTGSNMSGKSTFLRTVGLNQLLANIGGPVFGTSMTTTPLKIETCIEVSDSLRDGVSYFYAEVRRLKAILDDASGPRPVLYLIDEIFRGTNNRERQIGSRAVIQTLASSKSSLGFVSTHDLELVTLETTSPRCMNLHFREDIDPSGKMVFSYHLRPGPCPTTNALKIMQAEGIDLSNAGDYQN